jgi:hypothetical protein
MLDGYFSDGAHAMVVVDVLHTHSVRTARAGWTKRGLSTHAVSPLEALFARACCILAAAAARSRHWGRSVELHCAIRDSLLRSASITARFVSHAQGCICRAESLAFTTVRWPDRQALPHAAKHLTRARGEARRACFSRGGRASHMSCIRSPAVDNRRRWSLIYRDIRARCNLRQRAGGRRDETQTADHSGRAPYAPSSETHRQANNSSSLQHLRPHGSTARNTCCAAREQGAGGGKAQLPRCRLRGVEAQARVSGRPCCADATSLLRCVRLKFHSGRFACNLGRPERRCFRV